MIPCKVILYSCLCAHCRVQILCSCCGAPIFSLQLNDRSSFACLLHMATLVVATKNVTLKGTVHLFWVISG